MAADPDIQRRQHAARVQRYRARLKAGLVGTPSVALLTDPIDEGTPPHCYESPPDAPPHCYESPPEYGVSMLRVSVLPDERALSDMRRRNSERVKAYRARQLALDPDAPPHCYESPPEYGVSMPPDERELSDMRRRESERVKAYYARRLALNPEGTRELERERQRYYRAKRRIEAAAASIL